MAVKKKKYSTAHLILDFLLIFLTGGLWLVWMIVRALRSAS